MNATTQEQCCGGRCGMTRAEHEALVDRTAFEDALRHVESARYWRKRKAELRNWTSWTRPTSTPGQCEAKARRAEARVREIALRSEILLARRARAAAARPLA